MGIGERDGRSGGTERGRRERERWNKGGRREGGVLGES